MKKKIWSLTLIFIIQLSLSFPFLPVTQAADPGADGDRSGIGTESSTIVSNPLGENSTNFGFEKVFKSVRERLLTFVAGVAIAVLVIAGMVYIFSQGNEERTSLAKKIMTAAIVGLAVILGSNTILKELFQIFSPAMAESGDFAEARTFQEIVTNALKLILSVLSIIGIISIVWGGILYVTSGGNEEQAERAKKQIIYSIVGLVIALAALIIIKQVDSLLRGSTSASTEIMLSVANRLKIISFYNNS